MTARTFSRVTGIEIGSESIMQVTLFCVAGLSVLLLFCAAYELDLSPEFF
jgi:hypothetical protein